jgi:uncharacterized protein YbaA (DUF1428 family)
MAKYVDVYVLPVPKKNLAAYRRIAADAGTVWREHGALAYIEIIADDVSAGEITSFPQAVNLGPDETVAVGWIVFETRQHRDYVNAAVMKDPRMADRRSVTMPFDAKRMFWGGFQSLIEV